MEPELRRGGVKETVKVTDKRLEALGEELEAKCKELEARTKEIEELRAQALRLQADFENVKKRMLKEQAEFQESANGDLLRELLEIYDDFERGLSHTPVVKEEMDVHPELVEGRTFSDFRTGVEMIGKRFGDFLKSYGVVPMEAAGQLFDPAKHEAVAHEATDAVPESTVLAELRRGYLMNGRVLRHAVVKVAVKPEKKDD
ncbi:MAG: nucleotide exchange factor GrpE [Candidatus Omnitrophica bacterium]|nr:nucleotide exchange factor GrpE [Candidatus Omnitrophota bacterium]